MRDTSDKFNGGNIEIYPNYDMISKKACEYINHGDTIYLSSAMNGFLMTRHMPSRIDFTVITNNILTIQMLLPCVNIDLYICGGKLRENQTVSDDTAVEYIKQFKFDTAFLSCESIEAELGLYNGSKSVDILKVIIQNSTRNILMVPGKKIGKTGSVKICDTNIIDVIITDTDVPDDQFEKLLTKNIEVIKVI